MLNLARPDLAILRERVRSNYWFVPTLMAVGAVLLSRVTIELDQRIDQNVLKSLPWVYTGSADGARSLLSTVAGSMITVAGIIFSINIVVLTMASAQFGPRLLWNFIRDLGSQLTLGTFTSAFLYCLLVLRSIRSLDEDGVHFVPHLSVTVGTLFGTAGLGVLIYYVHHIAISIQAPIVVANVGVELEQSIREEFPVRRVSGHPPQPLVIASLPDFTQEGTEIQARRSGYVQTADMERLVALAERSDVVLSLTSRPGEFVIEGAEIVRACPAARVTPGLRKQIWKCFRVGRQRTPTQDIEFAVHQLVEVAVRVLSPAINDPFTCMTCIDWLGAGLEEIYQREVPSGVLRDSEGMVRLVYHPVSHSGVTDAAFNQIRQYGRTSVSVTIRLLEVMARVAAHARTSEECAILHRHAEMVIAGAREALPEARDVHDAETRYKEVVRVLDDVGRRV